MFGITKMFRMTKMLSNKEDVEITPILMDGKPIFFPQEIEGVLGYSNLVHFVLASSEMVENIDYIKIEDDRLLKLKNLLNFSSNNVFPFGKLSSSVLMLTESGLNNVIAKSTKPEASKIRVWVNSEVLPEIGKTATCLELI